MCIYICVCIHVITIHKTVLIFENKQGGIYVRMCRAERKGRMMRSWAHIKISNTKKLNMKL